MWTGVLKPSSHKDVWHGNLIVWACNASCFFIQVFNARTREICLKQSACIIIRSYSQWTIVSLFAWAGVKLFWITNYHHLWLPLTWISTVLNILIVFVSKYLFFTTRKRKWIKRKNQWQSMTKFKAAGILLFAILITFSRNKQLTKHHEAFHRSVTWVIEQAWGPRWPDIDHDLWTKTEPRSIIRDY